MLKKIISTMLKNAYNHLKANGIQEPTVPFSIHLVDVVLKGGFKIIIKKKKRESKK